MHNKSTYVVLVLLMAMGIGTNIMATLPSQDIVVYDQIRPSLYNDLKSAETTYQELNALFNIASYSSRYKWGNYDDAEWAYNKIINYYNTEKYAVARAYYFYAQFCRYITEDYPKAIAMLEKFKNIYDPFSYKTYGGFHTLNPASFLDDYHWKDEVDKEIQELSALEKLVANEIKKIEPSSAPEYKYKLGNIYKKSGQLDHAIKNYQSVTNSDSTEPELVASALLGIGNVYTIDYINVIEKNSMTNFLFYYTGDEFLTGKTQFYKKGIDCYSIILSKYSGTTAYRMALLYSGAGLLKVGVGYKVDASMGPGMERAVEITGDYDKAKAMFLAYIDKYQNDSDLPYAKYYLAVCYFNKGDNDKAKYLWSGIIREYPEHEAAKMAMDSLSRLGGN